MIRNALVVSGGGSKIAFGAGVLWHLIQFESAWWDVMTGVSSGSITIGTLAQAKNKPELKWQIGRLRGYLLESKGDTSFYSGGGFVRRLFRILTTGAMYQPTGIRRMLRDEISETKLAESPVHIRIGAVSYDTLAYRAVRNTDPYLRQWIEASSYVPGYFPLPLIHGQHWMDGGVRNGIPLADAFHALREHYPTEPWALDIIILGSIAPLPRDRGAQDVLRLVTRGLEGLQNENILADLREAVLSNDQPNRFPVGPPRRRAELRVWMMDDVPEVPIRDYLNFDPGYLKDLMDYGERVAQRGPVTGEELARRIGLR